MSVYVPDTHEAIATKIRNATYDLGTNTMGVKQLYHPWE